MIDNEGFNSLEYFSVMDGETDVLEMKKFMASRDVAARLNLGTVKIKRLQNLVGWIHDLQTHNQLLIAAEFGQFAKRLAVMGQ